MLRDLLTWLGVLRPPRKTAQQAQAEARLVDALAEAFDSQAGPGAQGRRMDAFDPARDLVPTA